jgi:hypothetical protein
MTKLCNTCEYLRYCARSGIEDVGCDRYKRDTTTNEEWLRRSASTEQLAEWISSVVQKAISIKENNGIVMLESAIWWEEWLKQPHSEVEK